MSVTQQAGVGGLEESQLNDVSLLANSVERSGGEGPTQPSQAVKGFCLEPAESCQSLWPIIDMERHWITCRRSAGDCCHLTFNCLTLHSTFYPIIFQLACVARCREICLSDAAGCKEGPSVGFESQSDLESAVPGPSTTFSTDQPAVWKIWTDVPFVSQEPAGLTTVLWLIHVLFAMNQSGAICW